MKKVNFKEFMKSGAEILFPARCSVCETKLIASQSTLFCNECWADIVFLRDGICRVCGGELAGNSGCEHLCGICLKDPPPYDFARSVVGYNKPIQRLLSQLKYNGDTTVVPAIRDIAGAFELGLYLDCNFVVPVPLYPARLRSRGINQSVLLAKIFFKKGMGLDVRVDLLVRKRATVPQTILDGTKRRVNLRGAFAMNNGVSVRRASVCLVDDVITTGTTVRECSNVLRENGAKNVLVLSLARAGYGRGTGV